MLKIVADGVADFRHESAEFHDRAARDQIDRPSRVLRGDQLNKRTTAHQIAKPRKSEDDNRGFIAADNGSVAFAWSVHAILSSRPSRPAGD
jgi:hypothetical protein